VIAFLRKLIRKISDFLDARYCSICHSRFVPYRDGTSDCPNLREEVKLEKGGIR
jgi:hypothetical protein